MDEHVERDPDQRVGSNRGTYDLRSDGVPSEDRQSGTAGLPSEEDVPPETVETIQRERAERLDPANRPETAEVDNTHRTFDAEVGTFTDDPGYDAADRQYAADDQA